MGTGIRVALDRFPGGKQKALTMSYDDARRQDIRLTQLFNRHGIKGTFHINAGLLGEDSDSEKLTSEELLSVYAGHEIAAHGFRHLALSAAPNEQIAEEVLADRAALEELTGAPVRGMSYAYGSVSDRVVRALESLGVAYCRTVWSTGKFDLPEDLLRWQPTCHHNQNLPELAERFLMETPKLYARLLYVWGHSYEFDKDGNWGMIESVCERLGRREEIWYATNIEIADYLKATQSLSFSVDRRYAYNPSALDVWVSANGEPQILKAGKTTTL